MTKAEFLRKLGPVLQPEGGALTGREVLADLPNWDSLTLMDYIALVDREFGVKVRGAELVRCETVDGLVRLVGDKVQG